MRIVTLFLALSGLLLFAAPVSASVIDVPASAKSGELISLLFEGNILGAMAMILNFGCLLFAGLIVGYSALSGVLNSAHEGQVMGKAYNSMWVPIRTSVAIALLLPFSTGFSAIQYGIVWWAGAGVGLAESTWTAALDFMDNNGTLYTPPYHRNGEKLATAMVRSSACLEAINRETGNNQTVRMFTEEKSRSSSYRATVRYSGVGDSPSMWDAEGFGTPASFTTDINVPIDICGRVDLTLQKPDEGHISADIKKDYMTEVQQAMVDLADQMYTLGRNLVNEAPASALVGDELMKAAQAYDDRISAALSAAVQDLNKARVNDSTWLDRARDYGFIYAGAYYMDIARLHQETLDFAAIEPTTEPPDSMKIGEDFGGSYFQNMKITESYLADRLTVDKYGDTVKVSQNTTEDNLVNELTNSVKDTIFDAIRSNDNPVHTLANVGNGILNGIYTVGAVAVAAKATAKASNSSLWLKIVPGLGAAGGAAEALSDVAWSAFKVVGFILLMPAAALAIYIPLTPFIFWMTNVFGWTALFLEALVAAPIWAAAHSLPDNGSAINSHARTGYLVLLSLFMRPTLMLFGLFGGMLLFIIVSKIALIGYGVAVASVAGGNLVGPVSVITYAIILAGLMITLAHRSFGMIHEIPDKVLRYIGAGQEQLGEAQDEQRGRQVVAGFAQKVERHTPTGKGGGTPGAGGGNKPGAGQGDSLSKSRGKTTDQLAPVS